jgi:hypothetical protein
LTSQVRPTLRYSCRSWPAHIPGGFHDHLAWLTRVCRHNISPVCNLRSGGRPGPHPYGSRSCGHHGPCLVSVMPASALSADLACMPSMPE